MAASPAPSSQDHDGIAITSSHIPRVMGNPRFASWMTTTTMVLSSGLPAMNILETRLATLLQEFEAVCTERIRRTLRSLWDNNLEAMPLSTNFWFRL